MCYHKVFKKFCLLNIMTWNALLEFGEDKALAQIIQTLHELSKESEPNQYFRASEISHKIISVLRDKEPQNKDKIYTTDNIHGLLYNNPKLCDMIFVIYPNEKRKYYRVKLNESKS